MSLSSQPFTSQRPIFPLRYVTLLSQRVMPVRVVRVKFATATILALLSTCNPCLAGTTGVMNGYVRDVQGRPTVNTIVDASSSSAVASTRTDGRGFFAFVDLPPDVYRVYARDGGKYAMYSVGVRVNSDQTTFITFRYYERVICGPVFNPVSVGIDQRSQAFASLDLRRLSQYPPGTSLPAPLLPTVASQRHGYCL